MSWNSLITTTTVIIGLCGYIVVLQRSQASSIDPEHFLVPAGKTIQVWKYNQTFSRAPDEQTETAWRSIFPKGRGFVQHEVLTPNVSGVAVFHELHCLSGIRLAYYNALNKNYISHTSDVIDPDAHIDAINAHVNPHHVRHCFDYLRQALMCAADTNFEPIDWKLKGSTGWGFKRQCRDYKTVADWAEKYRFHPPSNSL